MKNLFFTIIILFVAQISMIGQTSSIKIFTKTAEAKFRIYFQGEIQNNLPIKEITFDSLNYKDKYEIIISFTKDTIADIVQEIYLLKDEHKEYEIKKKATISKKSAKVGRKIGKFLKIGNHDKEEILYDVFYLDEVTKSEYLNN
ncbi:MAG: hypothetical protein ABFS35_16575 [Bacteroidota bacterium]